MAHLTFSCSKSIHYQFIDGPEGRPYLVFLHEGLGCTAMWKDFPQLLCQATGSPGMVYDRIGYGRSSPLTGSRTIHYLHEYGLTELPALLSALIPGKDYFLIGHSDGGSIALIHAADKPRQLLGIITEAAHVFVDKQTLTGIRAATDAYRSGKLRGLLLKYHGEKTEGLFNAWSDTWLSTWFQHWNIEYLLPSIECPVLALQGSEDQYGSAAQMHAIAVRTLAGQQAMIDKCGHTPHLEKTDVTLQLMKDFLNRHSPATFRA